MRKYTGKMIAMAVMTVMILGMCTSTFAQEVIVKDNFNFVPIKSFNYSLHAMSSTDELSNGVELEWMVKNLDVVKGVCF